MTTTDPTPQTSPFHDLIVPAVAGLAAAVAAAVALLLVGLPQWLAMTLMLGGAAVTIWAGMRRSRTQDPQPQGGGDGR